MIRTLLNILTCELCNAPLELDHLATADFYSEYLNLKQDPTKPLDIVDEALAEAIAYKCKSCGRVYKHSIKEIERRARVKLIDRALIHSANKMMINATSISYKSLIYCGKCTGYDGKGCCPKELYNICEIKRFPLNGL